MKEAETNPKSEAKSLLHALVCSAYRAHETLHESWRTRFLPWEGIQTNEKCSIWDIYWLHLQTPFLPFISCGFYFFFTQDTAEVGFTSRNVTATSTSFQIWYFNWSVHIHRYTIFNSGDHVHPSFCNMSHILSVTTSCRLKVAFGQKIFWTYNKSWWLTVLKKLE